MALQKKSNKTMKIKLKDRILKVGDKCEYVSRVVNSTGLTCGFCHVSEVVDEENKVYLLVDNETDDRRWIVQDIDQTYYIKKIKDENTWGEVAYILLPGENEF